MALLSPSSSSSRKLAGVPRSPGERGTGKPTADLAASAPRCEAGGEWPGSGSLRRDDAQQRHFSCLDGQRVLIDLGQALEEELPEAGGMKRRRRWRAAQIGYMLPALRPTERDRGRRPTLARVMPWTPPQRARQAAARRPVILILQGRQRSGASPASSRPSSAATAPRSDRPSIGAPAAVTAPDPWHRLVEDRQAVAASPRPRGHQASAATSTSPAPPAKPAEMGRPRPECAEVEALAARQDGGPGPC
jgi:hypothetical protein